MNTKEMIEVMQAYVNGKEIEYKSKDNDIWFNVDRPCWDWSIYIYRIKQKPQRTHKEIMSNWFLIPGHGWRKVSAYCPDDGHPYVLDSIGYIKQKFSDFEMKTDEEMWEE